MQGHEKLLNGVEILSVSVQMNGNYLHHSIKNTVRLELEMISGPKKHLSFFVKDLLCGKQSNLTRY